MKCNVQYHVGWWAKWVQAKDKAQDIETKALQEESIERLKIVNSMKEKIQQDYAKKTKQIETQALSRLEKIKSRQEMLGHLHAASQKEKKVRREKIREGESQKREAKQPDLACILGQDSVEVRCRKCDEALVAECIGDAVKEYSKVIKDSTGASKNCKVTVDQKVQLPPAPNGDASTPSCLGGVARETQAQILQMTQFILNEARDKAEEIDTKALQEESIERLKIVNSMKEKIQQDYARKTKQIETQAAIERSTAINRPEMLAHLQEDSQKELAKRLEDKAKQKQFITQLIVQGLLMLLEDSVEALRNKVGPPGYGPPWLTPSQRLESCCSIEVCTKHALEALTGKVWIVSHWR
eukprot:s780_g17.t1